MSGRADPYTEDAIPFSQGAAHLLVRVHHPRLLALGRVEKGEYNWAALTIEFAPARHLAEWVSLKEFLESFATRSLPLEQVALEVHAHVTNLLHPTSLVVTLRTEGEGGFAYEVQAS